MARPLQWILSPAAWSLLWLPCWHSRPGDSGLPDALCLSLSVIAVLGYCLCCRHTQLSGSTRCRLIALFLTTYNKCAPRSDLVFEPLCRLIFEAILWGGSDPLCERPSGLWFSLWLSWSYQPPLSCPPPKSPLFSRAFLGLNSPPSVSDKVSSFVGSCVLFCGLPWAKSLSHGF